MLGNPGPTVAGGAAPTMDAVPADTTSRLRAAVAAGVAAAPADARARTLGRARGRPNATCTGSRWRLLLLATLGLRLWGIKQGLPYSYNSDEARHYVPRAIAYFAHDYNPNYFLSATGATPSCSSIRRTRSNVRCDSVRWAASRSPITPERAEQHRRVEQHRRRRSATGCGRVAVCGSSMKQTRKRTNSAERQQAHHERAAPEHLQRLVLGVDPEDRDRCCGARTRRSMGTGATRGSSGWFDRDVVDRGPVASRPG